MNIAAKYHFSGRVANFQEKRLPEKATLAGYAALIEAYDLKVPLPRTLSATGEKHRVLERDGWRILTPRHAPKASFGGHLYFALKHEGLDLVILKRLFGATGPAPIETIVQTTPTGSYARRIWFLYEWLIEEKLPSYVEGQMQGGAVQGIGWALNEEYVRNDERAEPATLSCLARSF